jgi:hypothetical protein
MRNTVIGLLLGFTLLNAPLRRGFLPKSEQVMNELDVFVVTFGIAFFVASDRFKQLLSWMGLRKVR